MSLREPAATLRPVRRPLIAALALAALAPSVAACGSSSSHTKQGVLTSSTPVSSPTFRDFLIARIEYGAHANSHQAGADADCGIKLFLQQGITTYRQFESPLLQSQIAADGKQCASGKSSGTQGPA